MADRLIATKDFEGRHVVAGAKRKRIGKVRAFVFHPTKKRVLGFLVKRPDAALMFKRADLFVALDGYEIDDEGQVVVKNDTAASGKEACRALGVDFDACVLWVGMPAMTESGAMLGYIDSVTFDAQNGAIESLTTDNGAASDVLLGKHVVPARCMLGFRVGQGVALAPTGQYSGEEENADAVRGCILVSDDALEFATSGGAAAAAGKATAAIAHKTKESVAKAKSSVEVAAGKAAEKARPVAQEAAKKTGEAVNKGAYAAGRQLGRATGMFAAFKEEFDRALNEDGENEDD